MSRRKQDKPQHLTQANDFAATENRVSMMNNHDDGSIERSTVSEALDHRETSPGTDACEMDRTFSEAPLDDEIHRSEDLEPGDQEDTLPGEDSVGSPKRNDDSLKFHSDVERCTFDSPVNSKDPSLGKQAKNRSPPAQSRYPDSEDIAGLNQVDCKANDCRGDGGDQLVIVDDRHTSLNAPRPSNTGYCPVDAESHVTKLQSFVDSMVKLTEPSYTARPEPPPFLPQYAKITPTKASGCIGSYSGSTFRSGFPYFGYQSPADERNLAPTSGTFLSSLEQPLDLSTKKHTVDSASEERRVDRSSYIASPEVRRRCLERPERSQAEFLPVKTSYSDTWNRSTDFRPFPSEPDHSTSLRSGSYSAGKHRGFDAGKFKREQRVNFVGDLSASKAAQVHAKSEILYPKETKNVVLHHSIDDAQRSSSSVAGKRKYSSLQDQGSVHDGGQHSPGSESTPKCQRQSIRHTGDSAHDCGEGAPTPKKEDREYMNMRCSCGTLFESLYHLAIHIERSGHVPGSLRPESLADLPKLVRGQDIWMSQGPEQAELILRCVQCRTSFRSLPELTIHMIRTKHYVNIVGNDGSAAPMDYGDQPRDKESPQRVSLRGDSRRKNDPHVPSTFRDATERPVEMVQQRLHRNKSPRRSDDANDASVGMSQIQSSFSGKSQPNLQSSLDGRRSAERVLEAKHESDQCQEKDRNDKQSSVARQEISETEFSISPKAIALDKMKEGSRTDIRGDESLRRHSLASRLHSKISSVTSNNIQKQNGLNQSANSTYKAGARHMHAVSVGSTRNMTRVEKNVGGIWEKINDPGVTKSTAERHSSTSALRVQSPDFKGTGKPQEVACGLPGAKENDGKRRSKRPRETDDETEQDGTEMKNKSQSGYWKTGRQPSKDPKASRCLIKELGQLGTVPSTQDFRKERLLLNVSRWIASTELETKLECDETRIEDLDPADNRLELVSPPPQPVETSSILVAIKNFVDSSFCGQTFLSGSHLSNQTTFSNSSFPARNSGASGRKFPEINYTLNRSPEAGYACETSPRSSLVRGKPHLDVQAPADGTERKTTRPANEEKGARWCDVDDSSCKQPLTLTVPDLPRVNAQLDSEEEDIDDPEVATIHDLPASPLRNCKAGISDSKHPKPQEGAMQTLLCLKQSAQSDSIFGCYSSGSEAEVDRQATGAPRNGASADVHHPPPFPQSKPDEDSSDTVELEECSPVSLSVEAICAETDNIAADSTTESKAPSSPAHPGIVSTTYALSDDPLLDRSTDRKSISKPISFFLSSRSFETVC